jgi:hypothetical protein
VFNLGGVTVQLERFDCSVSNGQGVQRGRYIQVLEKRYEKNTKADNP